MKESEVRSVHLLLSYLAKAYRNEKDREIVRARLSDSLSRLKDVSGSKIQSHLDQLEHNIEAAISKERAILKRQEEEEELQKRLARRIAELEGLLYQQVERGISRASQKNVPKSVLAKSTVRAQLRQELASLEGMYSSLKGSGDKKKLANIKRKIDSLKKKLK